MTILNGVPLEPQPSEGPGPTASADSQTVGRVAGIVALISGVVFPPAGIVIGAIALQQARAGGYRNGFARAGLIIGIVLTVLAIVAIVALVILVPQWVQQIAQLCEDHGVVVESPGYYECTL
ncbi:DUF4190 domain-containing protein [Antiquaquibacter soli]|uniref:DUF4190 domain-containing protein n=1 Tax=Antiquaquibacter soli TaxID=3064523 RepID=A0ABT9BRL1_9MICO|nr:DUF4190 domain-containing protein [Protaetiibacter sp. WY-16]MDO7883574.1 DUF4190 domain-containing protein [Protaetiibacter sp. WY-16]